MEVVHDWVSNMLAALWSGSKTREREILRRKKRKQETLVFIKRKESLVA